MPVLLLPLALAFAVACGKSASEKPLPTARSHADTSAPLYDVVDLSGDLGNGIPDRISDDGIITGTAHDSAGSFRFTYDTSTGAVTRFYPPDGSPNSYIRRLLFNGDHCGFDFRPSQAYLQQSGIAADLGTLGGRMSVANDCNVAGQAVGWSNVAGGNYGAHAFFRDGSSMTDLGSFGGEGGTAAALNSQGRATGALETHQGYAGWTHAFFFDPGTGTLTDLGTLGKSADPSAVDVSEGRVINELGHIAGQSSSPAGNRGFLWDGQNLIDLGPAPGTGTQVQVVGMNDSDVVVGVYTDYPRGTTLAFAWLNGAIVDLNTVSGPTDMVLWSAAAVNNNGQIVGYGGTPNSGVQRAFLLQPR